MAAVATTIGLPRILPTLGRSAPRRAQRRHTLMCLKLGAIAAAAATAHITEANAASGVPCDFCGVWIPLPSCRLAPSAPSPYTAPIAKTILATQPIGTDNNSPGFTEDGLAIIDAAPVVAGIEAAAAPPYKEQLWKSAALDVCIEGASNMHDNILSSIPAGNCPQQHIENIAFGAVDTWQLVRMSLTRPQESAEPNEAGNI